MVFIIANFFYLQYDRVYSTVAFGEFVVEDNIIYKARLHWIIFLWPLIFLSLALIMGIKIIQLKEVALLFVMVSVIWIIMTWINFHFSSLIIKNKQVILRTGMMVRQTIDIPLRKIETIDIRQTLFGSIFRYGTLIITGTGGTRQMINFLDKPLTCRRYIEQLLHE